MQPSSSAVLWRLSWRPSPTATKLSHLDYTEREHARRFAIKLRELFGDNCGVSVTPIQPEVRP